MPDPNAYRLAPLPDDDWPDSLADLRNEFFGKANVYRTIAHHPALLRAWTGLRQHVVKETSLGRVFSEVVILRTAFRLGSDYEWAHHVLRAREVGLDDARIAALRGAPEEMAEADATLARAVDDLVGEARLRPSSATALAALVGAEGVLDLMATVGFYSTLGFVVNSFGTPIDPEVAEGLRRAPLPG